MRGQCSLLVDRWGWGLIDSTNGLFHIYMAWGVSQHINTCKNTKSWDVTYGTLTPARASSFGLLGHINTSKNTRGLRKVLIYGLNHRERELERHRHRHRHRHKHRHTERQRQRERGRETEKG